MNCSEKSDILNIVVVVNRTEHENTINKKQNEGEFHIYIIIFITGIIFFIINT